MALFSRGRNPNVQPYTIEIRGAKTSFAGDWYHLMLRAPWWFDVLAISKVPKSFSHHKTLVTSPGLGQCLQQPVTFLIEDDLDFLRHPWPRMHDLS